MFLVTAVLIFGRANNALSQQNSRDCVTDSACQALYEKALAQSSAGNLPEALSLYQLAYATQADPRLLFSIARLHHRLGQGAQAIPYYQRFLDSDYDDAAQKSRAQGYLVELQQTSPPAAPPAAVVPTTTERATVVSKPVYKQWWFWTSIAGGTAAAIAIGLGVMLTQVTIVPNGNPGPVHIHF